MPLIQLDNQNPQRGLKLNFNKINTVVSDENAPQPLGASHLDALKQIDIQQHQARGTNNENNVILIKPQLKQSAVNNGKHQTDENLGLPVLKQPTSGRDSPSEPSPPKLRNHSRNVNNVRQNNQPVNFENLIDFSDVEMKIEQPAQQEQPIATKQQRQQQQQQDKEQNQQPQLQPPTAHESLISRIPRLSIKFPLSLVNQNRLNAEYQQQAVVSKSATTRHTSRTTSSARLLAPLAEKDKDAAAITSSTKVTQGNEENKDELEVEEEIEDIDKSSSRDALYLVCDIAKDIYEYMYTLEEDQAIKQDHLRNEKIFTPKVRQRLVNWCIEIHSQLKLLPETLFITISLIDRFFDLVSIKQQSQVQLIAVGAMLIASKYEEIYPPDVGDLMHLTSNAYSRREIMRIEIVILEQLNFNLGKPIPLAFLRRFSRAAHCDLKMHSIAKYLMELSLTEYECAHWRPSMLAAAALFATIHLVHPDQSSFMLANHHSGNHLTRRPLTSSVNRSPPAQDRWNKAMIHYTHYTRKQLTEPAATLAKILKKAQKNPQAYYSVKKNLPSVGKWNELKSTRVDELIKMGDQI